VVTRDLNGKDKYERVSLNEGELNEGEGVKGKVMAGDAWEGYFVPERERHDDELLPIYGCTRLMQKL
jgi:hypothetical protein